MSPEEFDLDLARAQAEREWLDPNRGIVVVGIGRKVTAGIDTGRPAIVFGVVKKKPPSALAVDEMIPSRIQGMETDVIETGVIRAQRTTRIRPCPGGWSVGHVRITAGTLGCIMRRGAGPELYILSNNHVLANSNNAVVGDPIVQPGPYDGGLGPADMIASLTEWVRISFGLKKFGRPAGLFWRVAKGLPNFIARLVGCPYRLTVRALAVPQPDPNLVDAAIARVPNEADVSPSIDGIGPLAGVRDFVLGDTVRKSGRTTGLTTGRVTLVNASVSVQYGPGQIARFRDQFLITAPTPFSQPGDSGSICVTDDNRFGGLLFAGSDTATIVNRATHVVRLLGVTPI